MSKSLVDQLSENDFIKLVMESESISDIACKLGYKSKGGGVANLIKKRIDILSLNTDHFGKYSSPKIKYDSIDDILVENSTYTNNTRLKEKLLNLKLKIYKCEVCGIDTWQDNPLSLQLDHINGINNDNRLENLRFICPNCHSQTDTFSGKNSSRVKK